jgi:hypothetical protein
MTGAVQPALHRSTQQATRRRQHALGAALLLAGCTGDAGTGRFEAIGVTERTGTWDHQLTVAGDSIEWTLAVRPGPLNQGRAMTCRGPRATDGDAWQRLSCDGPLRSIDARWRYAADADAWEIETRGLRRTVVRLTRHRDDAAPAAGERTLAPATAGDDRGTRDGVATLVGVRYRDSLAGVEEIGSALLSPDQEPPYGFAHVRLAGRDALLLRRFERNDATGWTERIITDALPLPALPEGHQVVLLGCRADGRYDETVAAVVQAVDQPWRPASLAAWRADPATGRLVALATAGIDCENLAYYR